MNRYVLMAIGKTHSGKTTFANELISDISEGVIIETDPIALFLRETFSTLRALDLDHRGGFSSPSLKFLLFRTILTFALEQNFNVILSNSNMYENGRKDVLNIVDQYKYKTIGVYFNYSEEVLLNRVEYSGRDTKVLVVSKDFNELVVNQRTRFQPPNKDDFDYFFEITDPADLPEIKGRIIKLYRF